MNVTQKLGEDTIGPLSVGGVQHAVQLVLGHGLGVQPVLPDAHVKGALHGAEQDVAAGGLARARGSHHHQSVVHFL